MKFLVVIFGVLFGIAISGISSAEVADNVKNSRLYQSCKKFLADSRFEHSYCSHAVVSILSGFSLTLMHYPSGRDCDKELLLDVKNNSSFPADLTPKKVAENYLFDIEQGNFKIVSPRAGLDAAETVLVESFSKNFLGKPKNFSAKPQWSDETKAVWIRSWIKVKDLYLSCAAGDFFEGVTPLSDISKSREFCEGTIRGLAIGHVLALSILPTYDKSDRCFSEKTEVVEKFKKRMCLKGDASLTTQISMKFVDDIKKMSPEDIMSLGSHTAVEWVIAPYIVSDSCRRNLP